MKVIECYTIEDLVDQYRESTSVLSDIEHETRDEVENFSDRLEEEECNKEFVEDDFYYEVVEALKNLTSQLQGEVEVIKEFLKNMNIELG